MWFESQICRAISQPVPQYTSSWSGALTANDYSERYVFQTFFFFFGLILALCSLYGREDNEKHGDQPLTFCTLHDFQSYI